MSVEAPNGIKYQDLLMHDRWRRPQDGGDFNRYFKEACMAGDPKPPESPRKNGPWLEYKGLADPKNHAVMRQLALVKPSDEGVLKLTHTRSPQGMTSMGNILQKTPGIKHWIVRYNQTPVHDFSQTVAKVLEKNNGLAWLVLDHNKIDDRAVKEIAKGLLTNKGIIHLVLSDNQIENSGARELARAIKKHPSIQTLWISNNGVGDEGAQALFSASENHPSLRTMDIKNNRLSHQQTVAMVNHPNGIRVYGG